MDPFDSICSLKWMNLFMIVVLAVAITLAFPIAIESKKNKERNNRVSQRFMYLTNRISCLLGNTYQQF